MFLEFGHCFLIQLFTNVGIYISSNLHTALLQGDKTLGWYINHVQEVQATKQNIIQSGAFSREHVPDVMGALTSLKMTANFTLKPDGQAFFISEPTSDAQLKGMKEYLDRKGWWYEDK